MNSKAQKEKEKCRADKGSYKQAGCWPAAANLCQVVLFTNLPKVPKVQLADWSQTIRGEMRSSRIFDIFICIIRHRREQLQSPLKLESTDA